MKQTGYGIGCMLILFLSGCALNPPPPESRPAYHLIVIHRQPAAHHDRTQVGRYLAAKNGATTAQINPFAAISTFTFPPSVVRVSDAIDQVLASTGYQLSANLSPEVIQTLDKPLPLTNRKLGPMKIQTALEILMGKEVYVLQRDPLHRLINFKVNPEISKTLGVTDHVPSTKQS